MKEPHFLSNRAQYSLVYRQGETWANNLLLMKAMPNGLELTRCGFSVTRKVGKAVQRNHLKRLLREVMRVQSLKPGWDIVLVPRPVAANAAYHEIEQAINDLLLRAQLVGNKG